MITLISLPDVLKVNVSFSMFKANVRKFYLSKYLSILMLSATLIIFFIFIYCFSSVIVWGFMYLTVQFPIVFFVIIIRIAIVIGFVLVRIIMSL